MSEAISRPCEACPWRTCNQGKRHKGFYNKANLTRLWNGIRKGNAMSCHPTDPSHPDHGAKPDSKVRECAGAIVLVNREFSKMANDENVVDDASIQAYRKSSKRAMSRDGIAYWLISRYQFGGVPFVGGLKLPDVDPDEAGVDLPAHLREPVEA